MAKLTPEKSNQIRRRNLKNNTRYLLGVIDLVSAKCILKLNSSPIMEIEFCGPLSNVTSTIICEIVEFEFRFNRVKFEDRNGLAIKIPDDWVLSISMNGMGVYFRD